MITFTATYMPALRKGQIDPSKSGFATESLAWDYIYTHMCETCQREYERYTSGDYSDDWDDSDYGTSVPACACEWVVDSDFSVLSAWNTTDNEYWDKYDK